jgi:carboxymethylenebutenolidase
MSILPQLEPVSEGTNSPTPKGPVKTYRYPTAKKESSWILPSDSAYHAQSASVAHTRSLTFLKPLLNGPFFDLEGIWDEHCLYEFELRDVDKTMATMVAEPYVNHIPTMTGGIGKERLTAFYTNHFIFSNPDDTMLDLVSRTVGTDRVIDEFVFKFTHDRQIDWLLPGIPPTGKVLEIPFTSIVAMRGDCLCHEHISWDQGTALRQAGLLPEWVPFPYLVDGSEAGQGKRFEVRLPVAGVETSRKLVDEGAVESNGLMGFGVREVEDV